MNNSAQRINSLARSFDARTYLEIGVDGGDTFLNVQIGQRTGVDPNFRFDVESARDATTSLHQMTSDEFFTQRRPSETFDIVFIDGLHRFEQVVRDFANAISHTSARSVILFDDTKPGDVYSALPDVEATMRFRHAAGISSPSWHGDVFKVIFYLHDFWPSLNYRTLTGSGNTQTLVWRSGSEPRTLRLNNLEQISRLTYFDLLDNLDILRECPEDEGLALCVQEVNGAA